MRLQDAWALCEAGHAKLIVKDEADPLCWGEASPDAFGTLWMWTRGHSAPMLLCQRVDEMPSKDEQEICVCGRPHGFPAMRDKDGSFKEKEWELWSRLQADERWEPVFEMTPLDAMVYDPTEQEGQEQ